MIASMKAFFCSRRIFSSKLQMTRYEMYSLTRVSVADRLRMRSNDHIPPLFVELVINWLQGDFSNNLWNKITLIPLEVVRNAKKMQILLHAYIISIAERNEYKKKRDEKAVSASEGNASDVESDNETDERMFEVFFDDVLVNVQFMACAIIVYDFIFTHQDMFHKPYILQMYCEMDQSWSCQVSVNAGKMDFKIQPNKDGVVRGFLSFDPIASVHDPYDPFLCLAASLSSTNPLLFFLTIASNLLSRESDLDKAESKYVHFLPSIKEFPAFYNSLSTMFGPLVDSEDSLFFAGDARFVLLQIPKSYPIQIDKLDPSMLVKSSIMCLLFLFDICAAIAVASDPCKWKTNGSVKMKPVVTESWIFAIPESFKIGSFLREKYNI
jgi:hypothetical protein